MKVFAGGLLAISLYISACGTDPKYYPYEEPRSPTATNTVYPATATPPPLSVTAVPQPPDTPTPIPTAIPTPTVKPTPRPIPPPPSAVVDASGAPGIWVEQCGRYYSERVAQWLVVVSDYDWNICTALTLIDCESKGHEDIYNYAGSGACGLWQHLPCQHNGNGRASTALAWAKYQSRGWQPWASCM